MHKITVAGVTAPSSQLLPFPKGKACALCHLKRFPICEEAVSRRLTEWVFASAAASQKHA